jgi:GNAT superfamily N-acetyltransferase
MSRLPEMGIARRIVGALTGREVSIPNGAAERERARRAEYEARAAADPIRNTGDRLAYFGGQVVGGALDPTSWIGGGGSLAGRQGVAQVGKQVVRNAATAGASNAGADVLAQGLDVASDTQDGYDPFQTLLSAGVGATLSGGMDAGRVGFGPSVRAAGRGFDYARWAVGNASNQMGARFANPLPSFDGAAMASGPFPGPPESIARPGGRRRPARSDLGAQPPSTAPRVAIPEAFAPAIRRAASETGVSADYLASLANRESSFNPTAQAGTSSARGLYQFTEATWLETLTRHGDRLGLSNVPALIRSDREGVLSLRDNPELAIAAAALHSQDNARELANVLGRAPTDGELYSAHFLGMGGARQLATADPSAPASRLFPEAADANRSIFYRDGQPRTVAEVRARLSEGFGGGSTVAPTALADGPLSREASPYVADTLSPRPMDPSALGIDPASPRAVDGSPMGAEPMRSASFDRAVAAAGDEAPRFRAEDTPDGFRVFQEGRLRDVPMMWGRREGNDLRLESTALPPEMQGRGYGVEIYQRAADAATERGGRLLSDSIVRPVAANVYEALGRRGYVVTRDPAARMVSGAWEAPDGRPVFTVAKAPAFNPAKPFTVDDGVAPARLAARSGFDPSRPFTMGETLAVDMSGYADRIGQTVQSSGQGVGGLRDAPRPDAVARGSGAEFGGKSVSDLAADLRTALGLTHRQGRVGARGALGTYDTGSGVVRTKAVDELDVLAHEATHALEYELKGPALAAALKTHGDHLKSLAYPGAGQAVKRQEGFAEFGRWYLTNPDHARRIAPAFFDAFEAAMAKDAPEALAGMKAVQGGYQNLLSSASIDVAKGSIAYTGSKGPVGDLLDEIRRTGPGSTLRRVVDDIYTAVMDDLHPLAVAERKLAALYLENTGQKLDLKRAASPYALSRLSREAYAAGHNDLMNGVVPYRGLDPAGASLADALATAGLATGRTGKFKPDATREFDAYLISRRAVHLWDRYAAGDLPNPPDRNTKAFHEQVIADAEAANPTWAKAAGQVYEYLNNLWKKEYDAGLITREAYDNGLTHTDYVPFNRDMSDKGPGGKGGKPRGALQFAGGVKQLEGSSRDIISPLSSIMRRSYELNAIIKRNDVMKALDDMAEAAGRGSGAIVERLPAKEIEAFTVNAADALTKTAEEMGLSGRDLTTMQKFADDAQANDAKVTLFKQTEFSPRKGEAVVFVWRDGKKTPLLLADGEFGQQMFSALAGMNKELRNVVVDSMAAATQLLRYGVTLSPEFMAANIVRDSLATWINTDVGFVPVLDTIRGGGMELAQGQTAKRYAAAGGMRGGANTAATQRPFPHTDAEAEAQLQHLRRKGWKVKRYASWRGLAELTDLSETSTRIGVFKKGFDQAKARGLSDYEALIESGFTSRDYLDFARRGSKMLTASRIVTFLNAALQGLDKSTRVLTAGGDLKALLTPLSREARTPAEKRALGHAYKAWAKISALGALGLGLRMLYADDPEYQEINDRLRATHWVAKIGGRWIFIPKPFELATVSNILERGFEGTVLKDPTAGERLLSDFRHTIAPPSEIPALSVPFNIASNRDYLGRPIVPDHLRGTVDPELQFNSYTSDLGKLIGRTFNVSPAVADYAITGFGGSLGRYVLQGSNLIGEAVTGRPRTAAGPEDMFLARRFTRSISRGSISQGEFWDQVSKDGGDLTQAEGSFRALMRDGQDEQAATYLNRLSPEARAYVMVKAFGPDGGSIVHPLVRVQKVVATYSDFRTAVREGDLRDSQGAVIPLTPQDRRTIDNAVADLAQADMRNALIETGVRGWEQKDRMDPLPIAERIARANPEAFAQLRARLYLEKAPSDLAPEQIGPLRAAWVQLRPVLSARRDAASLVPMIRQRRFQNGDTSARYLEAQRIRGGAYGSPPAPVFNPARPVSPPPQQGGLLGTQRRTGGLLSQ